MVVLVTADIHLAENSRDAYRHRFMDGGLTTMIDRRQVDTLVILGDLTEEKDRHSAQLVNQVVGHVVRWAKLCDVILLRGNHDALDPAVPFFKFFGHIGNRVTWVNNPTSDLPAWPSDVGRALFLPYTSDYQKDWSPYDFNEYDWIFCHNMFTGSSIGNGRTGQGIPTEVFKGTQATVIAGDVHIPQQVSKNVFYVGAPYTVDFGDDYDPRVILITPKEFKSVRVAGPQKRLVEVTSIDELDDSKVMDQLYNGDILKVRISISPSDHARWGEMKQVVRAWGDRNKFIINNVVPNVVHSERISAKRRIRAAKSDDELVTSYAKLRAVDDLTLKVGRRLMEE